MPSFCRHGRFVERCPICSAELPTAPSRAARVPRASGARSTSASATTGRPVARRDGMRVRRETRAEDDGFHSSLVPGLRSSEDAERLAAEIGFAAGRLLTLSTDPPGLYGRAALGDDVEQATWLCLLIAYLSPLEGEDPFAGIRAAEIDWHDGQLPDLDGIALGPRTSHDPARGPATLVAYRQWAQRAGSQAAALAGDPDWTADRRFERVFERLALPGLQRAGRYDLLVTLGQLGVYDMAGATLALVGEDPATVAAKRVFGIGDRMNLERRARALSEQAQVPLASLDLALANWGARQRVHLGVSPDATDAAALERTRDALGL